MDHGIDENDNNGQRLDRKTEGGEHRAGRLSQIKNDKLNAEDYPTQYLNPENKEIR